MGKKYLNEACSFPADITLPQPCTMWDPSPELSPIFLWNFYEVHVVKPTSKYELPAVHTSTWGLQTHTDVQSAANLLMSQAALFISCLATSSQAKKCSGPIFSHSL